MDSYPEFERRAVAARLYRHYGSSRRRFLRAKRRAGRIAMDISPLAYAGSSLHQVAFVVRDLEAAQSFFNKAMGVPRFYVFDNFSDQVTDKRLRRRPVEQKVRISIAYSGDTQIELIQHVSGETCYKEFLDRRGEGLHHLGFFLYGRDKYDHTLEALGRAGYEQLMSGKLGESEYTYFDTEAAIGSIMEIVYLSPDGRSLMERIKSGNFQPVSAA
jgi:catechol 2,3-dioxygenase-like lactoylglutathione lyase family enzyme